MQRRLSNLSKHEADLFHSIATQLNDDSTGNKDELLRQLGGLAEKADSYETFNVRDNEIADLPTDGQIYSSVWPQAEKMRSNGLLFQSLQYIKCPVIVIHGEHDSHPVEGVTEPLKEQGVTFETHILPKCGHSPFYEKFAYKKFYRILVDVIFR